MKGVKLRLTGDQHRQLYQHLFPGDGLEAVAVALCGRRPGDWHHCLSVHKLVGIPYAGCDRGRDHVRWSSKALLPLVEEAMRHDMAVLRVHSHPDGLASFSDVDDASDIDLFASVYGWTDTDAPHVSAVMLPGGELLGRVITAEGQFEPTISIAVAGDDLKFWFDGHLRQQEVPGFAQRHAQLFGAGTTSLLRRLSVAVVGCSGTGSVVIELLARLGIGKMVLVDPDHVEEKNLNRILNASREDAYLRRPKVEVAARSIARMGFGTELALIAQNLYCARAVRAVAECDVVFGCMDSAEGRHLLGRIATFYNLPYFDVGVALEADGRGGIDEVCGVVHYVQPGGATLLERQAYSMDDVEAEGLRRTAPAIYGQQVQEGYIGRVREDRPAVISVNSLFASMLVNDFLARLHPFRYDHNRDFASVYASLVQGYVIQQPERGTGEGGRNDCGRGDMKPLLNRASLSE